MHSYGVKIYLYTYTNYFENHLHALKTNTYACEMQCHTFRTCLNTIKLH